MGDPIDWELEQIAARLRAQREALGIGSRDLGKRAGLSSGTVSGLERGRVLRLEVRTLLRLADALGVRRGWLLTGEGEPQAPGGERA